MQIMTRNENTFRAFGTGIDQLQPWFRDQLEAWNLRMESRIDKLPDRIIDSLSQRQSKSPDLGVTTQAPGAHDMAPQLHAMIKRLYALMPAENNGQTMENTSQVLQSLQYLFRSIKLDSENVNTGLQQVLRMAESADAVVFQRPGKCSPHVWCNLLC